jgi:hypothetical protein
VHCVDGVEHLREQALLRAAHRDDDAELRGARGARRACGGEHLVEIEERVDVDVGVEARRLRAERAVLGARTRLPVHQTLEFHLRAAVGEPDAMGERDERGELVEWQRRQREDLGARQHPLLFEQRALRAVEVDHGSAGYRESEDDSAKGEESARPPVPAVPP